MRQEHPILFSAIVGGVIGLLVALSLALTRFSSLGSLILVLWPAAMAGIAWTDPPGFNPTTVMWLLFLYVGNVLIYASVASIAMGSVLGIRGLLSQKNRHSISIKPE
jgi:hypothetical protein